MATSLDDALKIFLDPSRPEHEREMALQTFKGDTSQQVINALISALHDPDTGVRWAAGNVLAEMGEAALRPLLLELASPRNDWNLRDSAVHILHTSHSAAVRSKTADLQKALKGSRAEIDSMEEANRVLMTLH